MARTATTSGSPSSGSPGKQSPHKKPGRNIKKPPGERKAKATGRIDNTVKLYIALLQGGLEVVRMEKLLVRRIFETCN